MGSIITLDNLNEASELAPTQENFPALQHFFPMTETAGTELTDVIGGVVMSVDSISGDGNKIITADAANSALAAGSWVQPVLKSIVAICLCDYWAGAPIIEVGEGNGATLSQVAFGKAAGSGAWNISDGANTASDLAGGGAAAPAAQTMTYKDQTDIRSLAALHTIGTISDNGATAAASHSLETKTILDQSRFLFPSGYDCYGFLIFYFDEKPEDVGAAAQFMAEAFMVNGDKVIWPAWKGRT